MSIVDEVESVRVLLKLQSGHYMQVAMATGINYHWLAKFARGGVRSPRMDRVHTLDKYLNNKHETKLERRTAEQRTNERRASDRRAGDRRASKQDATTT